MTDRPLLEGVTGFLVDHIPTFNHLNAPSKLEGNVVYLRELAEALRHSNLVETGRSGGYFAVYLPESGKRVYPNVAIKLYSPKDVKDIVQDISRKTPDSELQKVLDDESFVHFQYYRSEPELGELSLGERVMLRLAWEHQMHKHIFEPYVLPSMFIGFQVENPVVGVNMTEASPSFAHRGIPRHIRYGEYYSKLKRQGKIAANGKEIIIKKGEKVVALVQEYFPERIPISFDGVSFHPPPDSLQIQQITQLEDFAKRLEQIYQAKGYFIDEALLAPERGNLGFLPDGSLILFDTIPLRKDLFFEKYPGQTQQSGYSDIVMMPAKQLRAYASAARKAIR